MTDTINLMKAEMPSKKPNTQAAKITTHSNVEEFLDAWSEVLYEYESANSLLLGMCERMKAQSYSSSEPPTFASVARDGKLSAAAVMTPPYNPVLAYLSESDQAGTEALARHFAENSIALPGVTGKTDAALRFAELYTAARNLNFSVEVNQRLYELSAAIQPLTKSGKLRSANESDRSMLIQWAEAFHLEATPNDPSIDFAGMVDRDLKQRSSFIWEDENGEPVSMARKARPTRNTVTVNLVYTPPEFRGRGYASCVVAELSQLLLDQGYKHCVLFTDLSNSTTNSIYQKIGYTPVVDVDMIKFTAK